VTVRKAGRRIVSKALRARRGRLTAKMAQAFATQVAAKLGGRRKVRRKRPRPKPTPAPAPTVPDDGQAKDTENPLANKKPAAPANKPAAAAPIKDDDLGFAVKQKPKPAPPAPKPRPKTNSDDLGFGSKKPKARADQDDRPRRRERDRDRDDRDRDDRDRDDRDRDDRDRDDRDTRIRRRRGANRRVVAVDVGLSVAWRRFLFEDGKNIAVDYNTGTFSQLEMVAEFYPLQLFDPPAVLKPLGLRLGYSRSAGLHTGSKIDLTAPPVDTSVSRFWGGLTYRLPRFSHPNAPLIDVRVGVVHSSFDVDKNPDVESLSMTILAPGVRVAIPLRRYVGIYLAGEYRALLQVKSPMLNEYLGRTAGLQGFAIDGGVWGQIAGGLGYRAGFTYERFIGELRSLQNDTDTVRGVNRFIALSFALTYEV